MASDRESRLDEVLDRQDIIDCISSISRGADRCDKALFVSAFHDGAIVSVGPFVGGPAELYDWSFAMQKEAYNSSFHGLLNHRFDFDGDTAHVETYYLFVGSNAEKNIVAGGRYIDRFERRDSRWGIVMRNNFIEWSSVLDAVGSPLGEIADLHLNGLPSRGPDDPSYARPLVNHRARNIP